MSAPDRAGIAGLPALLSALSLALTACPASVATLDGGPGEAPSSDGGDAGEPSDAGAGEADAGPDDAGASTTGRADPTLLPLATGQQEQVTAPAVAPGSSYLDPISQARVWRVTGPTLPVTNPGAHHDYASGPTQVSRGWGPAGNTHTLLVYAEGDGFWLVDFERGLGCSNWRQPIVAPRMDLSFTFSNDPATPHLAWVVDTAGNLQRLDTATNTVDNVAGLPKAGFGAWLQQDKDDRWFVALDGTSTGVVAWDRQSNTFRERGFTPLDEAYLERDGRYVFVNQGGGATNSIWDLETDTVQSVTTSVRVFHGAAPRGFFTAADVDVGGGHVPYFRIDPAAAKETQAIDFQGYQSGFHMAGQWVQSDAELNGELARQWILDTTYGDPNVGGGGGPLIGAIGLFRLDGQDGWRFLAHHYTSPSAPYFQLPRSTLSPDGRLVMFDSNRGGARGDVFVVEVPVAP